MGMFDSVYHKCECGGDVEWQSKADECVLAVYPPCSVPITIANDINEQEEKCPKCDKKYKIHGCYLPENVAMVVEEL
jgi:hypothetical protein